MSTSGKRKNIFFKDLIWHLIGSILPLIVGLFRVPIFTRYFTTSEYGIYGLVLITYTILSIFLFNWLSSCIWRFYNRYKKENKLPEFYSNQFILYLIFSVLFLVVALVWNRMALEALTKKLTLLIFFQLLFNSLNNYFLIVYRLEEQSVKYNVVTSLRAVIAFGLQFYLTFRLGFRIEAIPISMIIVEVLVLCYQIPQFLRHNKIAFSKFSIPIIKVFIEYSIPGILSGLGLYLLTSSDRYIIAIYGSMEEVGIYNQIYNLCMISIMAVIYLYFALINPGFLRQLELNFNATGRLTSLYIKSFVIVITPVVTYMSIFAYWVAHILLGREFRVGYTMIPWVVLSMYFYGLTLFPENRLKFQSNYRAIVIGISACTLLNIALNFILIPRYGYTWAAITTFISYFILMLIFYAWDMKQNKFSISGIKEIIPSLLVLLIQLGIYFGIITLVKNTLSLNLSLLLGLVFSASYFLCMMLFSRKTLKMLVRVYS